MALQMAYTDANDTVYPESYWRVRSVENMNFDDRIASLRIIGYKDAGKRAANKPPIGEKSYVVEGADFDKYFSDNGNNIRALAYGAIKSIADVLVTPAVPGTPAVKDADGNVVTPEVPPTPAVYKSFFDGAANV